MANFWTMRPETMDRWGWVKVPPEVAKTGTHSAAFLDAIVSLVGDICYEILEREDGMWARRVE